MKIVVLGTGQVGRALAGRLDGLGHEVAVGTRDPAATLARTETGGNRTPPYAEWAAAHPGVSLVAFAEVSEDVEVVVNASGGEVTLDVLAQVGAERLDGRVLIDVSNPLNSSGGLSPTLFVEDTDSLAERVQRAYPEALVVKTLNTMNNQIMVDPAQLGEPTSVFVSGDSDSAKAVVTGLLQSFGHTDVIDLGDLTTARGAEMLVVPWIRIATALGTSRLNLKVVR